MATRPVRRTRRKRPRPHPFLQPFLADCVAYRQLVQEGLEPGEADDPVVARTLIAIVLKACFLKLADERRFLAVDGPGMFCDLMKLRRHRPKPTDQLDMWRADNVRVAIDNLLEDLELDSGLVRRARLRTLHGMLKNYRLEILDRDILGQVYQALSARKNRKMTGQYYTPPSVVDSLLDTLSLDAVRNRALCVCDPACGSGQMLLGVYDRLKAQLLSTGQSREDAHRRILEHHLFGFDIDPFALTLTKMNLFLKERIADPVAFNIHRVNPLRRDEHELFVQATGLPDRVGHFDVVIGNPPWGSTLKASEKQRFKKEYASGKSGVNAFALFIERGLELLRPGGRLGYLIPDAYLNIRAHRASRAYLLDNAAIEHIQTCGELFDRVFAPSMLLVARREVDEQLRQQSMLRVVRNLGSPHQAATRIRQRWFAETPEQIFNVHLDDVTRKLLGKIANGCATLSGHAHFGLGLVTGDNERLVVDTKLDDEHEPLIVGKDVTPYRIADSHNWVVYCPKQLQQACPRDIFDAQKKLVYRFISKNLVFACDEQGRFTLNNANVLVPQLPGFRIKYLLALLNSSVLQFYYTFTFFTLKVLRGNLERLPLKYAAESVQREVEAMVDALATADEIAFAAGVAKIDARVAEIYGLDAGEAAFVRQRLHEDGN